MHSASMSDITMNIMISQLFLGLDSPFLIKLLQNSMTTFHSIPPGCKLFMNLSLILTTPFTQESRNNQNKRKQTKKNFVKNTSLFFFLLLSFSFTFWNYFVFSRLIVVIHCSISSCDGADRSFSLPSTLIENVFGFFLWSSFVTLACKIEKCPTAFSS